MSCFAIDDMIAQLVDKCSNKTLQGIWQQQEQTYKKWQQQMKVSTEIEINDQIDIRTIDYVWSVGTVKLIIE